MKIFGIDPNPVESGYVICDSVGVGAHGLIENKKLLQTLRNHLHQADVVAIERIRSYGQQVGNETINTIEWIGRFDAAAYPLPVILIPRPEVLSTWGIEKKGSDKWLKEYLVEKHLHLFTEGIRRSVKGALTVIGWGEHDLSALAVAILAKEKLEKKIDICGTSDAH